MFILCINQKKLLKKHPKLLKQHNQINIKMDTIFMNSENSKTSKPHISVFNLTDKLDLRRGKKSIAL